jgi:hypothetical protein
MKLKRKKHPQERAMKWDKMLPTDIMRETFRYDAKEYYIYI